MNAFEPHWKVLPAAQRALWPMLANTVELGFVLYGGTAAALRLGHRTSIDFDFFSEKRLDRRELGRALGFFARSETIQDRPDSLTILVPTASGGVKVSFFGEIDMGRVGVPDRTLDGVLATASLLDLLATKLKVMQQRIEVKDYLDVVAILRAGPALESGLGAAATLYRPNFQPSEAIKALTYFEGGDLIDLPEADRQFLIRQVSGVRQVQSIGLASRSLSANAQS